MAKMPFAVWQQEIEKFKNLPEAEDWRVRSRVEVEGMPSPWLRGQSTPPPISATTRTKAGATPMTDEYDSQTDELPAEEGLASLAAFDDGNLDFAAMNNPAAFNALYRRQRADLARETSNAAAQYKAAQQRISQQNRGMTQGQQLLALSKAMLTPTPVRGFAGVLGNLTGAFQDISTANRTAQQQREEQMARLQEQYQAAQAARQGSGTKNILELLKTYGALNKAPQKPRTGFNPLTGELLNMETNLPVAPPPPQVGEVRKGYRYLGGDPASQNSWQKVM